MRKGKKRMEKKKDGRCKFACVLLRAIASSKKVALLLNMHPRQGRCTWPLLQQDVIVQYFFSYRENAHNVL